MEALARYLYAAIGAITGTFGSPEVALFVMGVAAGLLSGPFSYAGRRALARIQALQPEIRELKAKHGDDSHALQRDLYRVPEIVTRGRFPDGGESDSTWRTQEARHVGSDTIAPGFCCATGSRFGKEDQRR